MSVPEIVFRAGQFMQFRELRKEIGMKIDVPDCTTIPDILPQFQLNKAAPITHIHIFGISLPIHQIHNWLLDVSSNKEFPKKYAKDINMRTDEYGSAKHVWELNRMLFLPQLALQYKSTGNCRYLHQIQQLLATWVQQNPYLIGINWYSNIEINIRLINWFLTWEILKVEQLSACDEEFKKFVHAVWLPAIYQHCRFSAAHPSLHSSANNHLIAEYAGLFIASSKWQFKESAAWNVYAKAGIEKQILLQHSENGINKEEAAMYISFITDFLLLCLIVGDNTKNSFSETYKKRFQNILKYVQAFLDIRGHCPKYGDEDDGSVFLLNTVETNNFLSLLVSGAIYFNDPYFLTRRLEFDVKNLVLFGDAGKDLFHRFSQKYTAVSSKFFPEDGHFIFKKQDAVNKEIYCHFNAAPIGYLSIAAHGHADALSFVLHVDGQPFFIDPGTYCYHTDKQWRKYFVSTKAHNTICINNTNQATFIGPTLWLDHYKVRVKEYGISEKYEYVKAEHGGFKKYNITHTRNIAFIKVENKFIITDYIVNESGNEYLIEMPFHLHPEIRCTLHGYDADVRFGARKINVVLDKQMQWHIIEGQYLPFFGWYSASFYKKTPSPVIAGSLRSKASVVLHTELIIM